MLTSAILKFISLFKGIYRSAGVNFEQLRTIVEVKLIMDNRRQHIQTSRKQKADPNNTFLTTLFFYTIFGVFIAMVLMRMDSFVLSMVIFFSYIMVMTAMTLITDFSSILLDTSDNTIILPRPVDSRTLFAARITHIIVYLAQIGIGLSIFPTIVVIIKSGFTVAAIFCIAVILSIITTLFFTNALYLLILQFASEEKLKNIINYFQIAMAVFIMAGYQFMPRFAESLNLDEYTFTIEWWTYLIPPFWMAGGLDMFHSEVFDSTHILLSIISVVAPLLGFYLVSRYLTPLFSKKLGAIAVETSTKPKQEKVSFVGKISKSMTRSSNESAAFELVYILLGRDRKIKLKIYPAFGYIFVFGFIFIFRSNQDITTAWNDLPHTQFHILLLYLCFMILQVAIYEIPYSDEFKASWVYYSAPLTSPGEILLGTIKAILVRLFFPGFIIISIAVLAIWGIQAIDDIFFALTNNLFLLGMIVMINKKMLPFSLAPNVRNQSGNFIRSMVLLLVIGLLGLGHYFLSGETVWVLIATLLQAALVIMLFIRYKKTAWEKIVI